MLLKTGALALLGAGLWRLRDRIFWPDPKAAFFGAAKSSGGLAFSSRAHRVVIVDATVNGEPVRALIDSGAQSSVIDRSLADRLDAPAGFGAPVVALGMSGQPQMGRSAVVDVRLGELMLKGLHPAVLELGAIASASGLPFRLILGQDMLRQVVADFDFPRERLWLHRREGYVPPPSAVAAQARLRGRELVVPVMIDGAPLEVVVDTGASGALSVSSDVAEALGLLRGRAVSWGRSISFGGLSRTQVVEVDSFSFAGRDYRGVPVHVYTAPAKGLIPDGLLGVGLLENYRVILDQAKGVLHLARPLADMG